MRRMALALLAAISTSLTHGADYSEGVLAYSGGDLPKALKIFKTLAEQGDARAQARLGFLYNNGEGVIKDDSEAAKWYHKAAEQGH